MEEYHNFLEKTIDEMVEIAEKYYTTVYISNTISDLSGGYYKVKGKIYYDCNNLKKFDYYFIKAWSKKQAKEFYRRINTHLINKEYKKAMEGSYYGKGLLSNK